MSQSILIVEDDPAVRKVFESILRPLSEDLTVVEDGNAALAVLAKRRFDLIVCDLNIPGPDGLEIARIATSKPDNGQMLVVSGFLEPGAENELINMGVACLSKPFRAAQLRAFVPQNDTPTLSETPA